MSDAAQERGLRELAGYVRRTRIALIVLTVLAYAAAYYVWTLGQTLGAIVIALFGYLVVRSRARLSYEMTCRHFRNRPAVASLLATFEAETVARGEAAMRRELQQREGDVP